MDERIEVAFSFSMDVSGQRGLRTLCPGHGIDFSRKDANCRIKLI